MLEHALRGLGVFVFAILIDIVWVHYIRATAQGRAGVAAVAAAGTLLFGAVNIISFVRGPWLLLPAALGAGLGTFLVVRYEHRKK